MNIFAERRTQILNISRYLVLFLVAVVMLYPLLWLVTGIWRSNHEIFTSAGLIPQNPVSGWQNIVDGWNTRLANNLGFYFLNTLRFLIPRVIGQVISCVLAAYAIARFRFFGKKLVFILVIATLLMPDVIFRIPMFILYRDLGMFGTFLPLWLDNSFAVGSFFVFMLIQFIRTIPRDLDEAATIDGCGSFQILIRILIPVMMPAVITVALLTFMWGMNDFLGPLIYIRDSNQWVLQQALRQASDMSGEGGINWGEVFAMSVIALIPAITLFFAAQRFFIEGIASTGSKE
ncbi:MAG: carbohydrate ABC transporter permease [Turicibacter sp.]|nr:carbohydrate ABC transporter permease [Turicibacter sp.]